MRHLLRSLIISFAVIAIASPSFARDDREDKRWDRDKKEQHHGQQFQPGELIWEDEFGERSGDVINDVAVNGNRVFAVGSVQLSGDRCIFAVRSYRADNGVVLWEDLTPPCSSPGESETGATSVVVSGSRVFVGGEINGQFTVRAYRQTDGQLLWEDRDDRSGEVRGLAIQGKLLVAAGIIWNFETTGADFAVRAYNKNNGNVIWSDEYDPGGNVADVAESLTIRRGRVVVVGWGQAIPGNSDFLVRTYRTVNGQLLWSDQFDGAASGGDEAKDVTAVDGLVFAVGSTGNAGQFGDLDFLVRAYNIRNGQLMWSDKFAGVAGEHDSANVVATLGGRVFVGGETTQTDSQNWLVRAYDARHGHLLWEDMRGVAGVLPFPFVGDITAIGNRVFAVGRLVSDTGNIFTAVSYNAKNGREVWQSHGTGIHIPTDNAANAVAVQGGRVFVGGSGGPEQDFLLQAYKK